MKSDILLQIFLLYWRDRWINLFLKHDFHSVSFHVLRNLFSCLKGCLPSKHNLKLDRKHVSYASLGSVSSIKKERTASPVVQKELVLLVPGVHLTVQGAAL